MAHLGFPAGFPDAFPIQEQSNAMRSLGLVGIASLLHVLLPANTQSCLNSPPPPTPKLQYTSGRNFSETLMKETELKKSAVSGQGCSRPAGDNQAPFGFSLTATRQPGSQHALRFCLSPRKLTVPLYPR